MGSVPRVARLKPPQYLVVFQQNIARHLPRVSRGPTHPMPPEKGSQGGPPGARIEQQFPTSTRDPVGAKDLTLGVAPHLGTRPMPGKKGLRLPGLGPSHEDNLRGLGPIGNRPAQRLNDFRGKDSAVVPKKDQQCSRTLRHLYRFCTKPPCLLLSGPPDAGGCDAPAAFRSRARKTEHPVLGEATSVSVHGESYQVRREIYAVDASRLDVVVQVWWANQPDRPFRLAGRVASDSH